MNQQEHDLRSLAWHTHVIQRMRTNPTLMITALSIAMRWKALGPRRSDPYINAWIELLHQDVDAVAKVATSSTEHATAMRQSSPLSCVLGPEERNAFWAAWPTTKSSPTLVTAASDAFVWPSLANSPPLSRRERPWPSGHRNEYGE